MKIKFASLASGSAGNAYVLTADGRSLMVDCGIGCREFLKRAGEAGVDPRSIEAVLFTHSHDDHVRGAKALKKILPDVKFFASALTAEAAAEKTGLDIDDFLVFEHGQPFEAGAFSAQAFSVPHDTPDAAGFVVHAGGFTYFHATDVGSPLESIGKNLEQADLAVLEFNHDEILLAGSKRSERLKRRIRGPSGHLSNREAASLAARYASARLRKLFLAHISRECNSPHLAEREAAEALAAAGKGRIPCLALAQDEVAVFESEV